MLKDKNSELEELATEINKSPYDVTGFILNNQSIIGNLDPKYLLIISHNGDEQVGLKPRFYRLLCLFTGQSSRGHTANRVGGTLFIS